MFNECGPADGLEIVIEIGAQGTCDAIPSVDDTTFVYFYAEPFPTKIGQYEVEDGSPTATSGAQLCVGDTCLPATVTLTLTQLSNDTATGTYHLVRSDGYINDGSFGTPVCHNKTTCG